MPCRTLRHRQQAGLYAVASRYATGPAQPGRRIVRRRPPVADGLSESLPAAAFGYEVCPELRLLDGDPVAVLFVPRERTTSVRRVASLLIGGDDDLVKPLAPDELVDRVRALLCGPPGG